MLIESINYYNFRNLKKNQLSFSKYVNFIYGKNGQGKTSLLELIYFLSSGKSFRSKNIKDLLKYNFDSLGILSNYKDKIDNKKLAINYKNKKDYYFNNNKVKYDEYIGKLNIVFFVPEDISIINDSPQIRRSFFDYEISQSDIKYYFKLKEFNKILKNRNVLLKKSSIDSKILDIYNNKFTEYAVEIIEKRIDYAKKLSIMLNLNYRKFFDNRSEIKVKYSSFIKDIEKCNKKEILNLFKKKIKENEKREKRYKYSLIGPQKDDFKIYLNNLESRYYASQGEKKSIVFALKISELEMIYKEKKEYPILLIDDLFSYFDEERRRSVLKYIVKKKIQIFITSNEKINIEAKFFKVDGGEIIVE